MVRKTSKKTVLPLLVIISAIIFTGLIGAITFQNIFPTSTPYVTSDSTVNLSYGIHAEDGLSSITHSWNGTNTTLYDSSLVLFMNFDNRSELGEYTNGSTEATCGFVRDLSMYQNNGTVIGCNSTAGFVQENVTWVSDGKYNGAFLFPNGYTGNRPSSINVTSKYIITEGLNHTFCLWVYRLGKGGIHYGHVISNGKTHLLHWNDGPTSAFRFNNNGGILYSKVSAFPTEKWIHICIDFNSTGYAKMYINGTLNNQSYTNVTVQSSNFFTIGNKADDTRYGFNGTIDEVMVWNRSLSSDEITFLYNSQITKFNESYFEYNITKSTSPYSISSFLCSSNLTGFETCSVTQSITQVNTIKANFSTSIKSINDIFYGSQTSGVWLASSIDSSDSMAEEDYLNAKFTLNRMTLNLENANADGSLCVTSSCWKDMRQSREEIKFAYEHGIKFLLIAYATPSWMAYNGTGGGWCTTISSCPPENITEWVNLINSTIYYITSEGLYQDAIYGIEIWNEPYLQASFLNNVAVNNANRTVEYNKLYNQSYRELKAIYPDIKIGSGAMYPGYYEGLSANFFGNFSNMTDFIAPHRYYYTTDYATGDFGNVITNFYDYIYANITSYNSNVTDFILGEWGLSIATVNNFTDTTGYYANQLASMYIGTLNYNKVNISLIQFEFAGGIFNSSDWDNMRYEAVSYPVFGKTDYSGIGRNYLPPFNVSKNFAHLCPSGGNVWQHENDGECVKWTACSKGSMFSIIGSNSCNYSQNYTANLSLTNGSVFYPYTSIMNYETGASIPVSSDGIVQLGVLDSYEILYLYSGLEEGAVLTNQFKFNEATGTRVYDLLQNVTYGTISGASWINDSIFKTLTSAIDYTISTSGLLVVSPSYLFNYMNASWSYLATWRDTGSTASLVMVDSLGNSTTFLSILIVISFAVVILTLFKPSVNTNPLGKPHY